MVRKLCLAVVVLSGVATLAGCAGGADAAFEAAWSNCVNAYEELPGQLDLLAQQNPGTKVAAETPCDNWVSARGEDTFKDFWGDPDEFMGFVVATAQVEALH